MPAHPVEALPSPSRKSGAACMLVGLALLLLGYLLLRVTGAFLITGDPLKQPDAVIPLGGGSAGRVTEAVALLKQYPHAYLILTEPGEVKAGEGLGSTYYRQVAIEAGLSQHAILVTEGIQRSTREEAMAALVLMQAQHMQTVIVVTEPYHTQRARMIFRDVFKGSGLVVRVRPVSNHWYRSDTWFLSTRGWRMTFNEYIKIASYLMGIYRAQD